LHEAEAVAALCDDTHEGGETKRREKGEGEREGMREEERR
jgi:hypothetical protein